ncbi:MAG: signal peptidase II [Proteobacteria bacterium]|nr:signal peptidase II [Pseudomonadota bacterium]
MLLSIKDKKSFVRGSIVALLIIVVDQISKWFVMEKLLVNEAGTKIPSIEVLPFFNLVMVWNKGISFGMFDNLGFPTVFIGFSILATVILTAWMAKTDCKLTILALSLIIGGAIANVIDRLRFGAVADFLDFYAGSYHWPAFNVADSCITIGAAVMIFVTFKHDEGTNNDSKAE